MIKEFQGKYRWLSNFWMCPIRYAGVIWPSVEHAFQGTKNLNSIYQRKILNCRTPGEAKKLGKTVILRSDWEDIKIFCMTELLRKKFSIPDLRERLLETGTEYLQEGNYWNDLFWGVNLRTGKGKNNLGKILMKVREEIQTG